MHALLLGHPDNDYLGGRTCGSGAIAFRSPHQHGSSPPTATPPHRFPAPHRPTGPPALRLPAQLSQMPSPRRLRLFRPTPLRRRLSTVTGLGEFAKTQKQRLKAQHRAAAAAQAQPDSPFAPDSPWEVTCGLEVHAQLNTTHKLFSCARPPPVVATTHGLQSNCGADARTAATAPPNALMALTDAALPGTQPRLNPAVLMPALRAALALQCTPARQSRFDRKHYFYWDQPAGYQLTQFYEPLARDGRLVLGPDDDDDAAAAAAAAGATAATDAPLEIRIRQVQIEQDTGKTLAAPPHALVDLNRVGVPLVEIITDPFPVAAATTAARVLAKLQALLRAADACVVGMEWGGLRADVNVSVRRRPHPPATTAATAAATDAPRGPRCEIKNMSSFKAVAEAVAAEARRQIAVVAAGGAVRGETRGWDAANTTTRRLRAKEGEVDYRYMPEPDLPPIVLGAALLQRARDTLPPLPDQIVAELAAPPFGLAPRDARTLLRWDDGRSARPASVVAYYKAVVAAVLAPAAAADGEPAPVLTAPAPPPAAGVGKAVGNWVIHELGGLLASRGLDWVRNPVDAARLADLVALVLARTITGATAKALLPRLLQSPRAWASTIVHREKLAVAPLDDAELLAVVDSVLRRDAPRHRDVLAQLLDRRHEKKWPGLSGFVVGQVIAARNGQIDAGRVQLVLADLLERMRNTPSS